MRKVCNDSRAMMGDVVIGNDLLARAKAAGLTVQVVGERLSVRGARIHEVLIRWLIEKKLDVFTALSAAHHPEVDVTPGPPSSSLQDGWDEARAVEVQAAIQARLDVAVAAIPAHHPRRQARLNVLANEPSIVARLMAKRDPSLWGWLNSLERMLERWNEEDQASRRRPVS